ncbi:MAG: anhydro-N-acetylmuramic acid kinase [Chitinophagaceae bacterium]|nr:anhydro-N-acetylmuramic acid kinase [Chitinophagaceae bacterium]
MIYRAIGLMSGSSLDGLDIAFTEFTETGGKWTFEITAAECIEYSNEWQEKLKTATSLSALDYQLLHTEYGHFIGNQVNQFIDRHRLHHKVHLVASHGHTSFHLPQQQMTAQLGDGAAIAAETKLSVISDLRALDIALGGQGAPIVPIGEKILFSGYDYFLNIGGIANISINANRKYIAFDVCSANRVLNMLTAENGIKYDDGGKLAASGNVHDGLLTELNKLDYYSKPYPKSLANSFGTDIVYPIIQRAALSTVDSLRTYVKHIAVQVRNAVLNNGLLATDARHKMLVTGGGALNSFLVEQLKFLLAEEMTDVMVPDEKLLQYKEAVIMALIGVLRWREEANVLPSVTGASRESIGGALWLG